MDLCRQLTPKSSVVRFVAWRGLICSSWNASLMWMKCIVCNSFDWWFTRWLRVRNFFFRFILSLNEFIHFNCGLIQCCYTPITLIGCYSMECLNVNSNWWTAKWRTNKAWVLEQSRQQQQQQNNRVSLLNTWLANRIDCANVSCWSVCMFFFSLWRNQNMCAVKILRYIPLSRRMRWGMQ